VNLPNTLPDSRRAFEVPLDLSGWPPFTRKILEELCRVPYGETLTYGELAARAGSPRAARAVGQAMAANPLPIVIPCTAWLLLMAGSAATRRRWLADQTLAANLRTKATAGGHERWCRDSAENSA